MIKFSLSLLIILAVTKAIEFTYEMPGWKR